MNEDVQPIAPVDPTPAAAEPTEVEAPVSLLDHVKEFDANSTRAEVERIKEAQADDPKTHPSAQQRRDQEGKFAEGKQRAKKQAATAEDVPRIRELTFKLREQERINREQERINEQLRQAPIVRPATLPVPAVVTASSADPEPKEDDPQYATDYGKYIRDLARWDARQTAKETYAKERETTEQAQAETQRNLSFGQRIKQAQARYADFNDVALSGDVPWLDPHGKAVAGAEPIDEFILDEPEGPDVLYYLRTHPEDIHALLRLKPLQQTKWLTLLGQRLSTPTPPASTRSGASRPTVPSPPKPPNLVRTEAQRAGTTPPPQDGSLSLTEHMRSFSKGR